MVSKKKKVFTEIETDFLAKIGDSNVFSAQNQVVSKKKKQKKKVFTEIDTDLRLARAPTGYATGHAPDVTCRGFRCANKIVKLHSRLET